MRTTNQLLQAATGILVAALLAVIGTGCWNGDPETEPTPTGQPGLRYGPLGREFCDEVDLPELLPRFGLEPTAEQPENVYEANPDSGTWVASCRFWAEAHETGPDLLGPLGNLQVHVLRPPDLAEHTAQYATPVGHGRYVSLETQYRQVVERDSSLSSPTIDTVPGSWDEGTFIEATGEGSTPPVNLAYIVRDDNMVMAVQLTAEIDERAERDAISTLHDLALASMDEAAGHIPLAAEE
jgi:hypothetical protein